MGHSRPNFSPKLEPIDRTSFLPENLYPVSQDTDFLSVTDLNTRDLSE